MSNIDHLNHIQFKKVIDRVTNMFNGQVRVFFEDDTNLVLSTGKRGLVLPRRKKAHARNIGAID